MQKINVKTPLLLLCAVLTTSVNAQTEKYCGMWATFKDLNRTKGLAFNLSGDGSGYMGSYLGCVPLRWRASGDQDITIRYSLDDGHLGCMRLKYDVDGKTLEQKETKMVRLRDGTTENQKLDAGMLSKVTDERVLALWTNAVKVTETCLGKRREKAMKQKRSSKYKTEEKELKIGSWEEMNSVFPYLEEGWSLAIPVVRAERQLFVSIRKAFVGGYEIALDGGVYVLGDETDPDLVPEARRAWSVIGGTVPANAKLVRSGWSEEDWKMFAGQDGVENSRTDVLLDEHTFYARYLRGFRGETQTPADALRVVRNGLGESMTFPVSVKLCRSVKERK